MQTQQDLESSLTNDLSAATVACQLTATGRGAIAVVSVHGPNADQAVLANFQPATKLLNQRFSVGEIRFGVWKSRQLQNAGESVVVTAVAPRTIEIHCHGGKAAVAAILDDLRLVDVVAVAPAEFDLRRGIGPEVAAMNEILQATNTSTTAAIVLTQLRGQLLRKCQELVAHLESVDQVRKRAASTELMRMRSFIPAARHLTVPWNIVIAGPPNVGKSSLINQLLGYQRAITFDAPGTTRDVIVADTAIHGWPVRLSDTAGIRGGDDPLESEGVRRALVSIDKADLLLLVVDASSGPTPIHHMLAQKASGNSLVVWNKTDLTSRRDGISAKTGAGISELKQSILDALLPACPTTDDSVPITNFQINTIEAAVDCQDHAACIELLNSLIETLSLPL